MDLKLHFSSLSDPNGSEKSVFEMLRLKHSYFMSCSANNKKKKPDEASIKFKLMGRQVELVIQNNTAIKAGRGRRLLESEPHRQT